MKKTRQFGGGDEMMVTVMTATIFFRSTTSSLLRSKGEEPTVTETNLERIPVNVLGRPFRTRLAR
jgi:hypothetical protein